MDNFTKEENKKNQNRKSDAKRSLNNYLEQLQMHFDLGDTDVMSILESSLRSKKHNLFLKKWWHIWK